MSKKIAIYFPGIGYHCDKPLLYYGRDLLSELGYEEYRNLKFEYQAGNIRGNDDKIRETFEVLYRQAEEQLADMEWSMYEDIVFVGKSIGTVVAAAYAQKQGVSCRQILYTPLSLTFAYEPKDAFVLTGSKDPWVRDGEVVGLCEEHGIPYQVIAEANHSLEVPNVQENLQILTRVMELTREYVLRM